MSSNNRLEINTKAFMAELRKMPEELRGKGAVIVSQTGNGAANDLRQGYVEGPTGKLRRGVKVDTQATRFGTAVIVKVTAPHAHLYEYGSQVRRNRKGANRGAMPPKPTAVPVFVRRRRRMYQELGDLMESQGLQVSGSAE